ncbi:MAG: formate dehydrogenase accessory protein FdhE [Hyphomicrobiales bacterium]|nr:formate dehydrogenase accessory protein FdhE [Hyphomicrobiales bacterium]
MSAVGSKNLAEWIGAAQRLAVNSAEKVDCPDCGVPALKVRDVEYGWGPAKGLERYLVCSNCGAFSAVNMRRARNTCGHADETEPESVKAIA